MDLTNIEQHPWQPYLPDGAKILILGTFPPGRHRWSMDFYYPNPTNDFWKMMGLIFFGDSNALYDRASRHYRLDDIKTLLNERGIALGDTAREVIRQRGNASDKFLEIVTPINLPEVLAKIPECRIIASTGEKAAGVIARLTGTPVPEKGGYVKTTEGLTIWRMPSTSRAYPMPVEEKARYYAEMFRSAGIL